MELLDRVDGVKGHYGIGRKIGDSIYWEFYNKGKWLSACEVFLNKKDALDIINTLKKSQD